MSKGKVERPNDGLRKPHQPVMYVHCTARPVGNCVVGQLCPLEPTALSLDKSGNSQACLVLKRLQLFSKHSKVP